MDTVDTVDWSNEKPGIKDWYFLSFFMPIDDSELINLSLYSAVIV